jgi:hypothetical protein
MPAHFHHRLNDLRTLLLRMGGAVEDQLRRATEALFGSDHAKARRVMASDEDIDRFELDIDEACIQLLALHQPAATDLRFIVAATKVVTELERIGDQAVNIARCTLTPRHPAGLPERSLGRMAVEARSLPRSGSFAVGVPPWLRRALPRAHRRPCNQRGGNGDLHSPCNRCAPSISRCAYRNRIMENKCGLNFLFTFDRSLDEPFV